MFLYRIETSEFKKQYNAHNGMILLRVNATDGTHTDIMYILLNVSLYRRLRSY